MEKSVLPKEFIAAIVPALNEEKTIASVVKVLRSSPLLTEVIVVSDGSTDDTAKIAEKEGAKVVRLEKPHGKGMAMLHGLASTDASIILFADADLIGFVPDHVEMLLRPVISGARIMNVGLRDRGLAINFLAPHLPLIAGERALRREVIESINPQLLRGYMVESAMNYYCRNRKMNFGSVLLPGLKIRKKYEKVGWPKALVQYLKMTWQIIWTRFLVRIYNARGEFNRN